MTCPPSSRRTTCGGWWGSQLTDEVVTALGAGVRRRGAGGAGSDVVIGHDMRDSWPGLAAAFARAQRRRRRRRRHRAGLHDQLLASGRRELPGRDVHREPQPDPLQRHQALPRGRRGSGQRTERHPGARRDYLADGDAVAGDARIGRRGTCSPSTPRTCASWSTCPASGPLKVVVDAGNGMGGFTVPAVLASRAAGAAARDRPALLRARRHLPEPRGQPARAGEPGRPAGRWSTTAPTSGSPSTGTPTVLRRRRARRPRHPVGHHRAGRAAGDRAGRAAGQDDELVIHNLITSRVVAERSRRPARSPSAAASATR